MATRGVPPHPEPFRATPWHTVAAHARALQSIASRAEPMPATALRTACHAEALQAAPRRTTPHSHYFFNDFRFDANLRCHTSEHLPQQNRAVH
jgi:hypothetical protein